MNTGRKGAAEESIFFDAFEDSRFDRLGGAGWQDTYGSRRPDGRDFSWYSDMGGSQLDHAFATEAMDVRIESVRYDWGESGWSDHVAMIVEMLG
jgi:exonuclease III